MGVLFRGQILPFLRQKFQYILDTHIQYTMRACIKSLPSDIIVMISDDSRLNLMFLNDLWCKWCTMCMARLLRTYSRIHLNGIKLTVFPEKFFLHFWYYIQKTKKNHVPICFSYESISLARVNSAQKIFQIYFRTKHDGKFAQCRKCCTLNLNLVQNGGILTTYMFT